MTVTAVMVAQTPLRIIPMGEGVSHGNRFPRSLFSHLMAVVSQASAIINIIFVDEDAQKFLH